MRALKQNPAKVLVIEDDPDVLNALNIALGSAGYDVDVLLNGKEILTNQFVRPDIFVIDKQLPDIDGLEICKFLHAKPGYSTIPVIIISASRGVKKKAMAAGASYFIEKPFAVKKLVTAIRDTLETKPR